MPIQQRENDYRSVLQDRAGEKYIVVPILYNIRIFIVKQNRILYIYYCKIFYNISVNIKALQIQIPKLSNNIIISSSTTKIEIEPLIYQKPSYCEIFVYKQIKNSNIVINIIVP